MFVTFLNLMPGLHLTTRVWQLRRPVINCINSLVYASWLTVQLYSYCPTVLAKCEPHNVKYNVFVDKVSLKWSPKEMFFGYSLVIGKTLTQIRSRSRDNIVRSWVTILLYLFNTSRAHYPASCVTNICRLMPTIFYSTIYECVENIQFWFMYFCTINLWIT